MRVRGLFFGVWGGGGGGAGGRELRWGGGARVGDVVRAVGAELGEDGVLAGLAVAVNREYAGRETALTEGDEVALLPPVSGGCDLGYCTV